MSMAASSSPFAAAPQTAASAALVVAQVSHSFGSFRALDDVSIAVASGSFTVLLGQNGAGKTTLFSLITRLYNNRSGALHVYGYDVRRSASAALARIGAEFQQRQLAVHHNVVQHLPNHPALPDKLAIA